MKKIVKKDKHKRELFYKFENVRVILKNIVCNKNLPVTTRFNACLMLHKLPVNSNGSRVNKRCLSSGRKNISSYKYKFSRLELSRYIKTGRACGFVKASW